MQKLIINLLLEKYQKLATQLTKKAHLRCNNKYNFQLNFASEKTTLEIQQYQTNLLYVQLIQSIEGDIHLYGRQHSQLHIQLWKIDYIKNVKMDSDMVIPKKEIYYTKNYIIKRGEDMGGLASWEIPFIQIVDTIKYQCRSRWQVNLNSQQLFQCLIKNVKIFENLVNVNISKPKKSMLLVFIRDCFGVNPRNYIFSESKKSRAADGY
eukprot:TRINITY_DN3220_c0_g3_i3.p2 TRINITY_DN3220_c0_g3~~TRINITY_DN3220_c0_g3_i3.p2  ORF type:complete len:208 (+),score=-5.07 TRINITY_DN3220_c0_g3_i3:158-781(+)